MSSKPASLGSCWTEVCWAELGTSGQGPCPAASTQPPPRPAQQPGLSWSDRLRADGKGEAACGSGMCSPYLWLPCNPGEGITLQSLPFSRSYSPSALGGAWFSLARRCL